MAWDDTKSASDDILSADWNSMVTDQKARVADTGDETISGVKTFQNFPITPSSAPSTNYQVANKKYVDDNAGGTTIQEIIGSAGSYVSTNGTDNLFVIAKGDITGGTGNLESDAVLKLDGTTLDSVNLDIGGVNVIGTGAFCLTDYIGSMSTGSHSFSVTNSGDTQENTKITIINYGS